MIFIRGLTAIILGVATASLINSLVILAADGSSSVDSTRTLAALAFVSVMGVIFTAPAWVMFCLLFLPIVTNRTSVRGRVEASPYLVIAAALGAMLIVPNAMWFGVLNWWLVAFALFGGVGGLSIALAWRWLVLNHITLRHQHFLGVNSA